MADVPTTKVTAQESLNDVIRGLNDDSERRLDSFALWMLQANGQLSRIVELVDGCGWPLEVAHVEVLKVCVFPFQIDRDFVRRTRALVGWRDCFDQRVDVATMQTFCRYLLAWSYREGGHGVPKPIDLLEESLAEAVQVIDRLNVVHAVDNNRPGILKGPFGLWATEDFNKVGRNDYSDEVDLSTKPVLRSAFGIYFRARGECVKPAVFDAAYEGEASAKYRAFQDLNTQLAPLGVSIHRGRLIDQVKNTSNREEELNSEETTIAE